MCGDEVECFKALLCASAGTEGLCGTSRVERPAKSSEFVFRLSWLGFLFMAGIVGFIKDGEDGSDISDDEAADAAKGGCIERPFMFLGRRGAGEVMGRIRWFLGCSETAKVAMDGSPPKLVDGKAFKGTRLTGESGDEEGEGSDSDEESVHDTVVVGEESADSDVCVEVLSRCWWFGGIAGGWRSCEGSEGSCGLHFGSMPTILGSTTVTVS